MHTVTVAASGTSFPIAASRPASPRLDLYSGIHKGLRSFMAETLVRVGRIDVADAADRDQALDQLEQLLGFCAGHLQHENTFVHTAIEARQPAGTTKIAEEHLEHSESIAALREEAAALRTRARVRGRRAGAAPVPPPGPVRRREPAAHAYRGDGAQRPALAALQRRRARRRCTAG